MAGFFKEADSCACSQIWAFGGSLNEKDGINYRKNFDKWFKSAFTTVKFPSKGTIFDYYINFKTAKFAPWSELVTDAEFDSATMSMGTMFISTPETASLRYFLDMMTTLKKPIMFVGGTRNHHCKTPTPTSETDIFSCWLRLWHC